MRRSLATAGLVVTLAISIIAPAALAATPATNDLTAQVRAAGVNVEGLQAIEVGGIVVLRGRTAASGAALDAAAAVHNLGYTRIANLIQVIEPADDARIERMAERKLGLQRSLDGCNIAVDSDNGVVHLSGKVVHELQKDVAASLVRNITGVRSVEMSALKR